MSALILFKKCGRRSHYSVDESISLFSLILFISTPLLSQCHTISHHNLKVIFICLSHYKRSPDLVMLSSCLWLHNHYKKEYDGAKCLLCFKYRQIFLKMGPQCLFKIPDGIHIQSNKGDQGIGG